MSNGVSGITIIVSDDMKQKYQEALQKEGKGIKAHLIECIEALITKHTPKEKKKK